MDHDETTNHSRFHDLDSDYDSDEEGPNEDLILSSGSGTLWLVKVPKPIMEAWSQVDKDGEHLATLRVFSGSSVIQILLPNDPSLKEGIRGGVFTLDATTVPPKNTFVVSEPSGSQPGMQLEASVGASYNARPTMIQKWERNVEERNREANAPKRQLIQIGDDTAQIKKIASGAGHLSNFTNMVKQKPKPPPGQFERAARIPKNELLDMLFKLFQAQSHWSMKVLRERTKQPVDYLRETLEDIAVLHKAGPHTNTWSLQPSYAQQFGAQEDTAPVMAGPSANIVIDSDEEDFDMEEVVQD